jgi:hypothetical protein
LTPFAWLRAKHSHKRGWAPLIAASRDAASRRWSLAYGDLPHAEPSVKETHDMHQSPQTRPSYVTVADRQPEAVAIRIITEAVHNQIHNARAINERLHRILHDLRRPPPEPVEDGKAAQYGAGAEPRRTLVVATEYVSKELDEMSLVLCEIERFV